MKSNEELQKERITEAYLRAIKRVTGSKGLKSAPVEKVREMARAFLAEEPPADPAYRGWSQGGEIRTDTPLGDTWYRYGVGVGTDTRMTLTSHQKVPRDEVDLPTLMTAIGDAVEPGHMVSIRDYQGNYIIAMWREAK